MDFSGKTIGFGFTGSHCTHAEVLPQVERLVSSKARVIPVLSHTVATADSRFGTAKEWVERIEEITQEKPLTTIQETEPFGPSQLLDCYVIAPCTGNTLARLANAITDGPVLMAAKAQLRNHKPVVIAISTNDALGLNSQNLSKLLISKDIYFVPFGQDDPFKKPKSIVAKMELIPETCFEAMQGKQLQPMLIERFKIS